MTVMKWLRMVTLTVAALVFFESGTANALVPRLFCVDASYASFVDEIFGKSKLKSDEVVYIDVRGTPDECPEGMYIYDDSWADFMADQHRERRWVQQSVSEQISTWAIRETALVAMFFLFAFVLGQHAQSGRANANNTRKFLGVGMIIAPLLAPYSISETSNSLLMLASFAVFLGCLLLFLEPIRNRFHILQTAFAAIDRPEDRPHTLYWFVSAYIASSAIILGAVFLGLKQNLAYVAIVVFAVTLADIVSGLVGFRFGRLRYRVPSLAGGKTYTRSVEGTLALYLTVLLVTYTFGAALPPEQTAMALIVLPLVITLAEMISPHSWDDPIMLGAGMTAAMAISA